MNRRNGKSKQTPAGRFLSIRRQRNKCWTLICAEALIAAHVVLVLPAPTQASPVPAPEPVNALSALLPVATSQGQSPGRSQREDVRPNREVPDVEPPPLYPSFSLEPSDEEIFRARVFREPLVPMDMEPERNENRALADAVIAYLSGGTTEDFRPWRVFLNRFPESRWRASLLTNLGIVYQKTGFLSRARAAFEEAWTLAKESEEANVKRMADLAITELLDMYGQFGDVENLEKFLSQVEGREMEGSTAEKRFKAEATVWGLRNAHETAIPSGSIAVERLFVRVYPEEKRHPEIEKFHAMMEGATLSEIEDLAGRVGLSLQRAYRKRPLLPCSHGGRVRCTLMNSPRRRVIEGGKRCREEGRAGSRI